MNKENKDYMQAKVDRFNKLEENIAFYDGMIEIVKSGNFELSLRGEIGASLRCTLRAGDPLKNETVERLTALFESSKSQCQAEMEGL